MVTVVKTDVCFYTSSFTGLLFEVLQLSRCLNAFQLLKNQMGTVKMVSRIVKLILTLSV